MPKDTLVHIVDTLLGEDEPDIIRSDLDAMGVDHRAAKTRFSGHLDGLERAARQAVLDRARATREARATRRERKLDEVRRAHLPISVLHQRIAAAGGSRAAHRDLTRDERDDLESYLADLLADDDDGST